MSSETAPLTFADYVRRRADDDHVAVLFDDQQWTYREWCAEVATRAALWSSIREQRAGRPPHIGLLMENIPDFTMWLGAAAVTGSTIVGINPTRRGEELARDITYTECQLVVVDAALASLVEGLDLGDAQVFVTDTAAYRTALDNHHGSALPTAEQYPVSPKDQFLLVFTSGTSGAPKAVITTQGRLDFVSTSMCYLVELTAEDITYISMPLFHSNALFTAWGPSVVKGATVALRRKFSASEFLADVRRYRATYFNYVGKPLAYVLATPERPDDADNPLVRGYGNEGSESDLAEFQRRFGCRLQDGYGQTETGASIVRIPGMPAGALGVAAQDTITILDPNTGEPCPPAEFSVDGQLLNAEAAIGEIVNTGGGTFEGYWNNDEANRERIRNGAYWTGDLGYRDAQGFFYFAGRSADWLRVDGENFAGAPIERIIMRHPDVILAAVYGVPDPVVGDRVMAAVQLRPEATFDIDAFVAFLANQSDLGPKWIPTFVQVMDDLPMTQTNKILKRDLVRRRWHDVENGATTRLWWRPGRDESFRAFTAADAAALREQFRAGGRENLLAL
ncbi:MAG: AMP-binding protein [Ilumatobacteraceae bacterium]